MSNNVQYRAGLYCRLSKDDEQRGESASIGTQRSILTDYCQQHQYAVHKVYVDDGYSGMNFSRPGFQELLEDVERGAINMVITKDLSRLGRDYIMTGYYSELYFQSKGVRYLALSDQFDSDREDNEFAPFKNILNEMYARDLSRKVKTAKHHRAKQGLFIGAQTPYGYKKAPGDPSRLVVDPEASEVVKLIFRLAEEGLGEVAIAAELAAREIVAPSVYKSQRGDTRFDHCRAVRCGQLCDWPSATVRMILVDPVYTGDLVSLKTEVVNCKTKQRTVVPPEQRIVTQDAHEAIISRDLFQRVQEVRATHRCPAHAGRYNLFRGKLFCECCGHPMTISKKQLLDREADIYLCMHHYHRPEECPRTHRIYHEMLYPYVLQEVRAFAKSMKRRKVNSPIKDYADITELTPEVLNRVVERIEIGHVGRKSKPGSVIQIYWKLG